MFSDVRSDQLQQQNHQPNHAYIYRVPSPPRIVVPPPALNTPFHPKRSFPPPVFIDFESNESANIQFLENVTFGDYSHMNSLMDWKYEWRRKAQKVLPFLYLGPMAAMKDREMLRQEGITMLLAIRNTSTAHAKLLDGSKVAAELGIQYQAIDVSGNPELIAAFPHAIKAINNHLSAVHAIQQPRPGAAAAIKLETSQADDPYRVMGKVLVYCESGNERSAGVVAAYLMAMYHATIQEAVQIVQGQRFCTCFDDSLKTLLSSYQSILEAKRDVARCNRSVCCTPQRVDTPSSSAEGSAGSRKGKRMRDDSFDDRDIDMQDEAELMDRERFEQRLGLAPFR